MGLRPRALQQQHEATHTNGGGGGGGLYSPTVCAAMWLRIRCSPDCEESSSRCTACGVEADDIAGSVGLPMWLPAHVCTPPNGEALFFTEFRVENDEALLTYVPPGGEDTFEQLLRAAAVDPSAAKVCRHMRKNAMRRPGPD